MEALMKKRNRIAVERKPIQYEPLISFEYNKQKERDKKAWQKVSDSLPDNAFADDVVPDDSETYGKVTRASVHIEKGLDHYDG